MHALAVDRTARGRLLDIVELAQPLSALECVLRAWVGLPVLGLDLVAELNALRSRMIVCDQETERFDQELHLAVGALTALRNAPGNGFSDYSKVWLEGVRASSEAQLGDVGRLRRMCDRFGGILMDSRANPYVLLLPQASGHWVMVGWVSIVLTDASPLRSGPRPERILQWCNLNANDSDAVLAVGRGAHWEQGG